MKSFYRGSIWIILGMIVGIAIPLILWRVRGRILWLPVIAGGILMAAGCVLFARQRNSGGAAPTGGMMPGSVRFDPERQTAVIRCSICTGEKVAGFKNRDDGHFTEVMLIRSPEDEQRFKEIYRLDTVRTEY